MDQGGTAPDKAAPHSLSSLQVLELGPDYSTCGSATIPSNKSTSIEFINVHIWNLFYFSSHPPPPPQLHHSFSLCICVINILSYFADLILCHLNAENWLKISLNMLFSHLAHVLILPRFHSSASVFIFVPANSSPCIETIRNPACLHYVFSLPSSLTLDYLPSITNQHTQGQIPPNWDSTLLFIVLTSEKWFY